MDFTSSFDLADRYSIPKNASLASSAKVQELKELRKKALDEAPADAQEIFEAEKGQPRRQKRSSPQVVTVQVNGTPVDIYCPLKRLAAADLVVALEPTQLAAVFEFLQEDCSMLETACKKRKYRRASPQKQLSGGEQQPSGDETSDG